MSGDQVAKPSTHRLIISCGSQSVFDLKEASRDLCEIIWLVDLGMPEMPQLVRLMRRTGSVVDMAGHSMEQVIRTLDAAAPTGVLNLVDSAAIPVAEIASALGLEFHSPEVARRLSDKLLQRRALRSAGVPTPAFLEVPTESASLDLDRLEREVGFPSVLKPRQGNGSRNVFMVRDRGDLERLLVAGGFRDQEPAGMMLEEFLPRAVVSVSRFDPIVSVESFVRDGEVHHLAVTGRLPFAQPFRETGLVLPSDLSPANTTEAERAATAAITALDVRVGCLHTEVKFTPDGPRIIEVNGRIGGGIPQLVHLANGETSVQRLAMQLALGVPSGLVLPITYSRIGWQRMVTPPVSADRIDDIAGLDSLKEIPGIDRVTVNRVAGEAVDWRRGMEDFVCQIYGSADDYDELNAQFALVEQALRITYDEGTATPSRPQHGHHVLTGATGVGSGLPAIER
jgi:predicted ATP-grasp superfamily ATP-dependent carboligase